ncbi:Gfo/Idh/MocA family protein [Streptomyces sp. NBC_00859]|uniref:Gfo/Idh/MocA family protein n=1 Tax=Streptomyces sp. NBC_00859 TaxID=2903682 RepID=UPI00386B7BFE|nr:Gfo/Idh/MocA family oxidoreductase [Streptomyces sp. NBC_00859]
MASEKIRVGIIGASPGRGWAARAHVPALTALADYEITAVATSRAESAEAAARQFGAAHAFTDPRQLAGHPEVDLVAVTVKVPAHVELVQAALEAGKHVYCEWPLTRTTEEAEALLKSAEHAGVHHAVGLQARYAPAIGFARDLIADGWLGRVNSATVYAARGKSAGEQIPAWSAYTLDRANGAGLLEVAGGHTLDALEYLLGDIADLSAGLSVQHPTRRVAETGEVVGATSPDHLLLNASLTSGAVVSAHIHDAKITEARTRLEIAGTEGDLAIVSTGPGGPAGVQIGELRLLGNRARDGAWQEIPLPDRYRWVPESAAATEVLNVAQLYARLAGDLRTGGRSTPGFGEGLRLHRLLDAIRRSAGTGTRQTFHG